MSTLSHQLGNYFAHRGVTYELRVTNWRTCEFEPHELKDEIVSSHIRLVWSKGMGPCLMCLFSFFLSSEYTILFTVC